MIVTNQVLIKKGHVILIFWGNLSVISLTKCITCSDELDSEDVGWCHRCARFAPLLVGAGFSGRPSLLARQEVNRVMTPDRGRSVNCRWRALMDEFEGDETDWAFSNDASVNSNQDNISDWKTDPWNIDDSRRQKQLEFLRERICFPNRHPESSEAALMQRGIPLPNGQLFSKLGEFNIIDGKPLPGNAPTRHILRALTGNSRDLERIEGCNWGLLLTTLSLVTNRWSGKKNRRLQYEQRNHINRLFLRREHPPGRNLFQGADLFLRWNGWMNRLAGGGPLPYEDRDELEHVLRELGDGRYGSAEFDWGTLGSHNQPWVERWRQELNEGQLLASMHDWAGVSLRSYQGRLQLRTIKEGKWIWSPLPTWPRLWALLVSWDMSPPASKEHERLRAVQWCWHSNSGELIPSEPERRALNLLKEICESDEKIQISSDNSLESLIIVEGTSGLFYGVGPGPGAHNARFTVTGAERIEDFNSRNAKALCIHESGQFNRLPIGDVISSVILTLIDDITSAKELEPLAYFIAQQGMRGQHGVMAEGDPDWLRLERQRFMVGRGRGRGRWLNLFPAIFRVMVNAPIDTVLRIPQHAPNEVVVEDTLVAWMAQDRDELELVRSLARLTGFRVADEQDVQGFELFERVLVPVEGVRRELVELLGPYERRHGRPGEPPWWNLFPNPVQPINIGQRLPNHLNMPLERYYH